MSDYIVEFLSKFVLVFVLAMSLGLSACGGGGDSAPQQTPTVNNPTFQSITGGGIKGPLANAVVTVFAFDAAQSGFKGAAVTTTSTDASAAITGLNLPLPLNPAYIMEFSSVPGTTTDITTDTFPVITTIRTVITQALLNSGKDIYATPLTTLAVDIAVMNAVDTNGTSGIQVSEFEAALALAETKVKSTLGFGLDSSVDIFDTPPLINSATISIAEQANVAGYRSAVEAITAIAYQISQQSKTATVDTVLADLAVDLADNDMIDGSSGSSLNANTLQVLQQNPSSLPVPNTFPVKTIADVQTILAGETAITGSTTATTNLLDGTIVTKTKPVRTSVDTDGDGVFNIDDDLPDNKDESVDSDGDGIGDKADSDDDNDGILDVDEGLTSTPTANDTDGDGIADTSDNCPNNFNPAQTNSDTDADGDACDLDDDGDGVNDTNDAFPGDGSKSVDTDSDGIDDSVDIDDDNDTVDDIDDTGLGLDGLTSCSLLTDCDDDGVLDGADADRTDPNIAINFSPITNNDAVTVDEDAVAFLIDVTANDIDDIVNLSAVGPNDTNLGAVTISANSIEYTPVVNANGVDTFTYTVTDGNLSSQGQVTVTIVAVNDTPVAIDDTVITSEGVAVVTGDVTANDVDVDGDVLTATLLANASKGNVVDNGNGTFRYTPNANFNGSDSFTYTVSDANSSIATSSVVSSTTGTVNIIVNPVNNNPFAKNDNASVNEEQRVNINLAANDTDIDSALDLTSIVITLSPSNGTLVLNVNGTVDYTHDGSETITDSFTYTIKDSSGAVSNVATVMLVVNPLNDAPVANNDSASVNKGQSVNINLAANDTDAEGAVDLASVVILSVPSNGALVVNANGTVDYTHDGSVTVTDLFTYTIQDANGAISNIANVALNVSTLSIGAIANALVDENSIYTGVTPVITGTPLGAVTYSLSGIDAASFTINVSTGVVSMVARDFELPGDADVNNVYAITITATDANNNTATRSWIVSVQDVVEVSAISIGAIANVNVNENSVYTGVVPTITGAPIGTVTYSLSGIDAASFTINASTGVVSMVARDFEIPVDADVNNVYALAITATDTDANTASETWTVTVTDVTEIATFTINTISNASVNENSVYTGVVPTITGDPIGAVTYSLSGIDAASFTINASTGVVNMVARDFELAVDANANNVYALAIIATDADRNTASEAWNVTVVDVAETATFTINTIASASVNENSVYTSVAPTITGTPIGALSYTLSGIDAADFTINAATGVVNMVVRNFEVPADANTDNIYDLSITASDADGNAAGASWSVTVTNVIETATFTINTIANANVNENSVYTSVAPAITGTPIGAVTYTLSGIDAADFTVNASTGVVSMIARDFESPVDANTDNIYDLSVTVTDADGNTASEAWNVTVVDVIETTTFTIDAIANASVNENSVYTSVVPAITGTPVGAVTYALSGVDAADFTVNATTGLVSMIARNFELPVDTDVNNVYAITITATDADGNTASEAWNVTVVDVAETATFTINTIAKANVNENSVYTSVVPAITGTPIGAVNYTLGGADATLFTIISSSGVVSMVARDFELPVDANANNVYALAITATDADGNTASEAWNVTVTDVIETATFTINTIANASVNENSVYTGVIPMVTGIPIGALTYSLSGADAADFTINVSTGVVSMVARNFESPADTNTDNIYDLSITATDADGNTAGASWSVTVTNVIETATFTINMIANASVNENSVYTSVVPVITGTPIGAVTYTLSGIDAADFTVNASTGVVSMIARDFESPVDANTDNIYDLSVTVTDADGNTASESWNVTVVDVIEAATFTINTIANASVNENSVYTSVVPAITGTPVGAVTYALSGVDAADFTVNASTGVVSMIARDFELPVDADVNNVYALTITATDANNNTATQSWTVTVQDAVEISVFSLAAIANVNLNENSVYTSVTPVLTGNAPIGAVTYTLAGTDAADFTINASTGVVSMVARDFESPADANTDNIYDLSISAIDEDSNSASQSWAVSVQDVVELLGVDDIATVNEGQSVNINLAANDVADNVLNLSSIVIASPPSNAVLVVNVNGTVDYTHDGSETITDSFTYTILDVSGAVSNIANVTLTVNPVNDLPVGNADSFTVDATTATLLDVLANDTDADDTLTISNVSQGSLGSTVTNNGSTVTFTDINNATGSETFTYDVTDGTAIVTGINVTVNIIANIPNTLPVANDDNVTTIVDTTVVITNVLANDTDIDGDVLTVVLPTPTTLPANGSVIYNGSGTFTYTPVAGFLGTDSFTYTVTDSIASAVGTVIIAVTPPGAPIDIVTLMSSVEGGVAGIENAEANVYAYWTDNYKPVSTVFVPEDKVYNHLSGVFDTVVNTGDLLLNGSQWVSEGEITGIDDGNGGLDLIVHDLNNVNVEVASFKLTARYQDLSFLPIINHLNTVWRGAMRLQNERFSAGAKLITDYRFETLTESHILMHDNSCQKDGTTKFTDLNGNCNSVDAAVNITGYAKLLSEVVAGTAWVDPNNDFSTPPGAVIIATNDVSNKSLLVQLVSGGLANYYEVHWDNTNALSYVSNAVAGTGWVQNSGSGVEMIHFQVPASFIKQYTDDLSHGLNYFLSVQNGYVRQGLKHVAGDVDFSDGHFNGNALNDILANFRATTIPGLVELTGTWVDSVASANGDSALIHIFANGNYESSGSCDLDGSTGMEYGTVLSSGSTTNIIATALVSTQGLCGPAQGNKTLAVNGDVLTLSELGFPDMVYNRLLGTLNPVVGSWLHGDIQNPGEAHTILTFLDDTRFTLSQDCTTNLATGFEYGTYSWDQGNTNNLTGVLSIDSNGGCGLHDNAGLTISGFTVTVVGDTLTLTDTVGGGGVFIFTRVSPAYVVPMLQMFYTLDNLMMDNGEQITGSFTWSYVAGDFAGGTGQFTDLTIPGYGTDITELTITFDIQAAIEITLTVNTNNNGVTINLDILQPLSLTQSSPINLSTSAYEIEIGARSGLFVSGTILPQIAP